MKLLILAALVAVVASQDLPVDSDQVGDRFPLPVDGNVIFSTPGDGSGQNPTSAEETTPPATTETTQRPIATVIARTMKPRRPACKRDSECGRVGRVYCDRFYQSCHECIREQQLCRRDSMCCKGMECLYGKCGLRRKLSRMGSLCKQDVDCPADGCCGRQYGRPVCKPLLTLNQQCHPPAGGLLWSIHSHCQCAAGLHCVSSMESYRLRIGWYILTFPFRRLVSRCKSAAANSATPQPTVTTVRETQRLFFGGFHF